MLAKSGPRILVCLRRGEIGVCGLLFNCPPILAIKGVKAISPGRKALPLALPASALPLRSAGLPLPREPYVVFLPAPDLTPGLQSGSVAFSKPRGLWAGRVKLVVFWGEPLVAKAEETLRDSAAVVRGRWSSLRSFASFEESGRRRRLHREVVQGRVSSVDMAVVVLPNSCGINTWRKNCAGGIWGAGYVVLSCRVVLVLLLLSPLFVCRRDRWSAWRALRIGASHTRS